jgi:hypothetical protein
MSSYAPGEKGDDVELIGCWARTLMLDFSLVVRCNAGGLRAPVAVVLAEPGEVEGPVNSGGDPAQGFKPGKAMAARQDWKP